MDTEGMSKKRPVSKGLLNRVALYIRDNSINGECIQDEETMAYHLGLTVDTVHKVIAQLSDSKLIVVNESIEPGVPNTYIYVGEGAVSKLILEAGKCSKELNKKLDSLGLSEEVKEIILDYDEKVRELMYETQQQNQIVEAYKSFKDSIIKAVDTPEGQVHIIARKRP